jgi:hypothetical protein
MKGFVILDEWKFSWKDVILTSDFGDHLAQYHCSFITTLSCTSRLVIPDSMDCSESHPTMKQVLSANHRVLKDRVTNRKVASPESSFRVCGITSVSQNPPTAEKHDCALTTNPSAIIWLVQTLQVATTIFVTQASG